MKDQKKKKSEGVKITEGVNFINMEKGDKKAQIIFNSGDCASLDIDGELSLCDGQTALEVVEKYFGGGK